MALTERSRRRLLQLLVVVQVLVVVGLALGIRAVASFTDSGFIPDSGPGRAQMALGIVVGVLGVVVQARAAGGLTTAQAPRERGRASRGALVRLPRRVRRDVLRGRDVPERFRAQLPAWLDKQHRLCADAAGQLLWTPGIWLIIGAQDKGGVGYVVFSVALLGGLMLLLAVPLAVYVLLLRRARYRHTPGATTA